MVNLRKGDKVMIMNVDGIHFGDWAWKNYDVTTVAEVLQDGVVLYATQQPNELTPTQDGKVTQIVTEDEYPHLAKLLPVNATPVDDVIRKGDMVRIVDVDLIMYGYEHFRNGEVVEAVEVFRDCIYLAAPNADIYGGGGLYQGKPALVVMDDEYGGIRKERVE